MININTLWIALIYFAVVLISRRLFESPKIVRWFYVPVLIAPLGLIGRFLLISWTGIFVAILIACLAMEESPSGEKVKLNSNSKITKSKLWKFLSN